MMIVVVIIAILATVAVVAYTRHIKSARLVDARTFVTALQSREEMYFQQNGMYLGDGTFHPALVGSSEPIGKTWSPAANSYWDYLAAKPENTSNVFFSFAAVASVGPGHALSGDASAMGLVQSVAPAVPHPWFYIIAKGNMDGQPSTNNCGAAFPYSDCTIIYSTSASGVPVTINDNK